MSRSLEKNPMEKEQKQIHTQCVTEKRKKDHQGRWDKTNTGLSCGKSSETKAPQSKDLMERETDFLGTIETELLSTGSNSRGQSGIPDHGTAQKVGGCTCANMVVMGEPKGMRLGVAGAQKTRRRYNTSPPHLWLIFLEMDSFSGTGIPPLGAQSRVLFLWFHPCAPRTLPCTELLTPTHSLPEQEQGYSPSHRQCSARSTWQAGRKSFWRYSCDLNVLVFYFYPQHY